MLDFVCSLKQTACIDSERLVRCVIGAFCFWCHVTLLQHSPSLFLHFVDIENNCHCTSN